MMMQPNIRTLANALNRGTMKSEQLVTERLAIAQSAKAKGVFTLLGDQIIEQAQAVDKRRAEGKASSLAGIPIALKDLFDVRGQQTLAGSKVLRESAELKCQDGEVVGYLREAGLMFLGRTNMSEFAFSGMGLNPHYPPLTSVWDRDHARLPGGSSSGSAVAVALGIVPSAMGSDTAGSCRIPAAFNGIVGAKPSYGRLSLQGVYPLSPTSDAPGPLALDVDSCFLMDHIISGKGNDTLPTLKTRDPKKLRLLVPESIVTEALDAEVEQAFNNTISLLEAVGVTILRQPMPVLDDCVEIFLKRPVVVYEAWQDHQQRLAEQGDQYDPYVFSRMHSGKGVSQKEQQQRYADKAALIQRFNQAYIELNLDAVMYPTVPCIPPLVAPTLDADKIGPINLRCLRNTATVNYFDGCAISLPCHAAGTAPVGVMLSGMNGDDEKNYQVAATIEAILMRAQ